MYLYMHRFSGRSIPEVTIAAGEALYPLLILSVGRPRDLGRVTDSPRIGRSGMLLMSSTCYSHASRYLPYGWWHIVRGSAETNLTLNYWYEVRLTGGNIPDLDVLGFD